jgi:hypothetical protein
MQRQGRNSDMMQQSHTAQNHGLDGYALAGLSPGCWPRLIGRPLRAVPGTRQAAETPRAI